MFNKQPKIQVESSTSRKVGVRTELALPARYGSKERLSISLDHYQDRDADLYLRVSGGYSDKSIILTFKDLLAVEKFAETVLDMVTAATQAAEKEFKK